MHRRNPPRSESTRAAELDVDALPGCRPAVFDDVAITVVVTLETSGTGTRYTFTVLHRNQADVEKNTASSRQQGTEFAPDLFVAHVLSMKQSTAT